jgi:hypothetical protein
VTNEYYFISQWRVAGTCGEVADVLGDPLALPRWWPSVYLDVWEVRPPSERGRDPGSPINNVARGIGQRVKLHTKGWLPYTLRWQFEVVESRYPHGFTIVATGDFDGRGVWTFEQDGAFVNITYDWRLRAEKPLLRSLSPVLKPLFEANHQWAMARGEESLKLELARRRTTSDTVRAGIPAPPGPITYAAVGLIAGAAAIGGTLAYLIFRSRRR